MVPFATPVMRDVARTEQPSTSAEITETFLAVLILFIYLVYYTALACEGEKRGGCDGRARDKRGGMAGS
jgi:hypothetical protein